MRCLGASNKGNTTSLVSFCSFPAHLRGVPEHKHKHSWALEETQSISKLSAEGARVRCLLFQHESVISNPRTPGKRQVWCRLAIPELGRQRQQDSCPQSMPSLPSQCSQSVRASEVAQEVKSLATKPDFRSSHPCGQKKAEIGEIGWDRIASN